MLEKQYGFCLQFKHAKGKQPMCSECCDNLWLTCTDVNCTQKRQHTALRQTANLTRKPQPVADDPHAPPAPRAKKPHIPKTKKAKPK